MTSGETRAAPDSRPARGPWRRLAARLERDPLAVLGAAGITGAVASTLVNVAVLALAGDAAHLRDLQAVGIPARVAALLGSDLIYELPAALARSRDVATISGVLTFCGAALVLAFAFSFVVVAVAALPTALAWRAWPAAGPASARAWWWGWAFPTAALIALCTPGIQAAAVGLAHGFWEARPVLLRVVACAGILWAAVAFRPRPSRRLAGALAVMACVCAAAAVVVLAGAGVAAGAEALTAPRPRPAPEAGAPSLLLVSIDTLRADHLHCYGYARDTSPALDALAREGALFRAAFAHTPWTLPSHLTLLSGLPPEVHGVSTYRQGADPTTVMLAQRLEAAGYDTAGFVSLPGLRGEYGFARGFATYDDWSVGEREFGRSRQEISSRLVVRRALEWLSARVREGRARPFFLFVHLADVHNYFPPQPYDTMFGPGPIDDALYARLYQGRLDPRDVARVVGAYDGGVRSADAAVGALVAALRSAGRLDGTLIVITADHGEEFLEHGQAGHGRQLYNESLHVPLIVRFPARVAPGTVVAQPVGLVDVVPTVLALLRGGAAAPWPVAPPEFGRDLAPLLRDGTPAAVPESPIFGGLRDESAFVEWRGFKLIRHLAGPGADELYDLGSDPGERHDVAAAEPAAAGALADLLASWSRRCAAVAHPVARYRPDAEQLRLLRALGYM